MARRNAGRYKGNAPAGPSTPREEYDGPVLGTATVVPAAPDTDEEQGPRYTAADGATYCGQCHTWWLGNRPPGSDSKANHDPRCKGTMQYTTAVIRCDKGCGFFFNEQLPGMPTKYLYADHLGRYMHYGMLTGDYEWAEWESPIKETDVVAEEQWQHAKMMGWLEKPKKFV